MQVFLSPRNFIIKRAKSLPIVECLIEENYVELGITNVIIARQEGGGKYTIGVFCIDMYCLGVKNAFCNCHLDEIDYTTLKEHSFSSGIKQVTPTFAHNLIYGALDYATEIGFKPHKDFAFAEHVLDDALIDDGIDEIEFGCKGKPCYVSGPYDDAPKIIAHLNKYVGIENYDYILQAGEYQNGADNSDGSIESEIEAILMDVLFFDTPMDHELYLAELEEYIDEWKEELHRDKEDFVYIITEDWGSVAMVLITKDDELFVNEKARQYLQNIWKDNYQTNIKHRLSDIVKELANGNFSITGVTIKRG